MTVPTIQMNNKEEDRCGTNIELSLPNTPQHLRSSLQEILAQVVGGLSKFSSGGGNGTTISPVINLKVKIVVHAPSALGGGATVNYRPSLFGRK